MSKILKDLRKLSHEDLQAKVSELRSTLVEQRRALAAGELPNPHAVTTLRKQIAIALTLLNETAPEAETSKPKAEKVKEEA